MAVPGAVRVVERELRVYRRLWRASVFSTFVGPSVFLGAMGLGLGGLIGSDTAGLDGLSYLEFVAPGLMAATAVQLAAADSLWPVMGGTKWVRYYHGIVATPLRAFDVYLGHVGWVGLRITVAATAYLVVATLLGATTSAWAVLAVPAAVLTGLAFAAPITAFAATQETDARFALVMRFLVLPLFLFSGTFFPITELPGWLQLLAWCSPLWHGVVLCRAATTGILPPGGAAGLAVHAGTLVAFVAAGVAWGSRAFHRRLTT